MTARYLNLGNDPSLHRTIATLIATARSLRRGVIGAEITDAINAKELPVLVLAGGAGTFNLIRTKQKVSCGTSAESVWLDQPFAWLIVDAEAEAVFNGGADCRTYVGGHVFPRSGEKLVLTALGIVWMMPAFAFAFPAASSQTGGASGVRGCNL